MVAEVGKVWALAPHFWARLGDWDLQNASAEYGKTSRAPLETGYPCSDLVIEVEIARREFGCDLSGWMEEAAASSGPNLDRSGRGLAVVNPIEMI